MMVWQRHVLICMLILAITHCALWLSAEADQRPWWKNYYTVVSHPNQKRDKAWELGMMAERSSWATGWYGAWWIQHQLLRRSKYDVMERVDFFRREGVKNVFYYDAGELGEFVGLVHNRRLEFNQWDLRFHHGEPGSLVWFGKAAFYQESNPLDLKNYHDFGLPVWTLPDGRRVESVYDLARTSLEGKREAWDYSSMTVPPEVAKRLRLVEFLRAGTDPEPAGKMSLGRICSYDHSNPFLLRDFQVGVRMMLTRKPAFLHFDNYFDNETLYPQWQAFGPWSLENFRRFVEANLDARQCREIGLGDPGEFDLKKYIEEMPFRSRGLNWHYTNRRWHDDPIWNVFICSKRADADRLFRQLYTFCKTESRRTGEEVVIVGNTNPLFPGRSLVTGALDIAHFEHHAACQFGPIVVPTGLPPLGKLGGITRLGAAISAAGYCWPSVYVPRELSGEGHENLHKVMAMDALANKGVLDYNHQYRDGYSPGSDDSAAWVNCFIKTFSEYYGGRVAMADVGLVFPGQSLLADISVFTLDPEKSLYDYLGWAQALTDLHLQWDVVPDHQLSYERLSCFKIVVLPSAACLSDQQLAAIERFGRAGGNVIVSGNYGTRYGVRGFCWYREGARSDAGRRRSANRSPATLGHVSLDRFVAMPDAPGKRFYMDVDSGHRKAGRDEMERVLGACLPKSARLATTDASPDVGVFAYREADGALAVDLVNYGVLPDNDQLTPAENVHLAVRPPVGWRFPSLQATLVDPDLRTRATKGHEAPLTPWHYDRRTLSGKWTDDGGLELSLPRFNVYSRVTIELQKTSTNHAP